LSPGEPDRYAAIEGIFAAVLDVAPDHRSAWLDERCGSDHLLRGEVEALLAAHDRTSGILDAPVMGTASDGHTDGLTDGSPERRIGPYRVIRELGRGGMGVVFLAERVDGQFERRVAIKVLRAGLDTEELRQRLVAERQILASLSHPNIAQLLDGGVSGNGLPYLVIEYVDGATIGAWCDAERLTVPARLRVFFDICSAVAHAHQNLVLHRDLKPGNVLVTRDGQVKLLDFGIAKLLGPGIAGIEPVATRATHRLMTPAYASPEQVRGEPLTTATDVYGLGLLLYDLLVGRPAQHVTSDAPQAVYEAVCRREPVRPSDRVMRSGGGPDALPAADPGTPTSIAAARGTTPERLRRELRGDLDAIVEMALRKEPARRYGSVALLAADLTRWIEGQPVLARRGSAAYRAGKLLRRHRVAATATAAVLLAIIGGASAALRQAGIAARERDRATAALARSESALRESEEVAAFLVELFGASDPVTQGRADTLSARDLLRRGEARAERLTGEPLVQARMLEAVGRGYVNLGDTPKADTLVGRALALYRTQLGEQHAQTASSIALLADLKQRAGQYSVADSLAHVAWRLRRSIHGETHPLVASSLRQLAGLAVFLGDFPAAERHMRGAVDIRRRAGRGDDSLTVRDLQTLAAVRWRRGDRDDAERILREAVAVADRVMPPPSAATATTRLRLADRIVERPGGWPEAESLYRRALADTRAALGDRHAMTVDVLREVGSALVRHGDAAEGTRLLRESLESARRIHGPWHESVARGLSALAGAAASAGRLDEAERLTRDALPIYAAAWGEAHSTYAGALGSLGELLARRGQLDSAEVLHRRAIAIRTAALGPDVALIGVTEIALADVLARQGRRAAAESVYVHALTLIRRHTTDEHPDARRVHAGLAALYASWGREREAEHHRRLATLATPRPGPADSIGRR
jgi:serine/threonine-protein kinase